MIGPNFANECIAAGLGGLRFSWMPDGTIAGRENLTNQQNAVLDAVLASHDPSVQPLPPVPVSVSDRQFYHALAKQGVITNSEALQAVRVGAIPTALQTFLDANMTGTAKFDAEMLLSGAIEFRRDHPLTVALAAGMGWTDAQTDDLWRLAATL